MIKIGSYTNNTPQAKKLKDWPHHPGCTFVANDAITVVLIIDGEYAINITASHPLRMLINTFELLYFPCEVELKIIK